MSILAKKTSGGGVVDLGPLAPAGVHQAVCVDAIDLGEVPSTYQGKTTNRWTALMVWQLVDDHTQKRYLVAKRYSVTLNERSNWRKDLESWAGKPVTREMETNGFDMEKMIGAGCTLVVVQVTKNDRTYANVQTVLPRNSRIPKLAAVGYQRHVAVAVEEPDANEDPFADDAADPPEGFTAPAPPVPVPDSDIPF